MFLYVQKRQPGKTLQNSMEKIRPEKQCKHILRKKRGRRPLLSTVVLGRRRGTTSREMVPFWSVFILFLGEQNLHIPNVEIKSITPNKYFTPSLIYLPNENSLHTSSWLNLSKKMVTLIAEANPVSEEISWKFLLTLNSLGTWIKKKIFSFETIFYL